MIDPIKAAENKFVVQARQRLEDERSLQDLVASFPPTQTLALLDGSYLYETAQDLQIDIDYQAISRFFTQHTDLLRLKYYATYPQEERGVIKVHDNLNRFFRRLEWLGYVVDVTLSAPGASDRSAMKIAMATDILELAFNTPTLRNVVVFSGDGDFARCLQAVQRRGIRTTIVGDYTYVKKSSVSISLIKLADRFVEFLDFLLLAKAV